MMKKKKKFRITEDDYVRAIKKAEREIDLELHVDLRPKLHKSKRAYKRNKKVNPDEEV